MKATFLERVGAYFIDMLIVSFIFSLICLGFGNNISNSEFLMEKLDTQLIEGTITTEEYLEEYKDVLYDYQKETILQSGISVALTIAYYVIFQYMNKGQTLGKKLLKIKVVDKNTEKPITLLKCLLRTFIVYSILSGTISILLLYIINKQYYFIAYTTLLLLEAIFTLITVMFVLYKKDGRGLHDIMANTVVIKESR